MRLNGTVPTMEQVKTLALTNYGHFTSMRVDDGHVRGLTHHLQRLLRDSHALFNVELDVDRVRHFVRVALDEAPALTTARVTIYDPALDLGTIGQDAEPHVLVTARAAVQGIAAPIRLRACSYVRDDPKVKHIGLCSALRRRRGAQRDGFDDVLFLNPSGAISEIATSNIGFVRDGHVIWPHAEYLSGVTMTLLQQALDEPRTVDRVALSDLGEMDAVFATNAATGLRAVSAIEDREFPEQHPVLDTLRGLYADIPGEKV